MNIFISIISLLIIATGASANLDSVAYYGATAYPIGDNATFGCVFQPDPNTTYDATFQIGGNYQSVGKVKDSGEESFVYDSAPEFIKDRFVLHPDKLAEGRFMATITDVQAGDDNKYACYIEAGQSSTNYPFKLKVYQIPDVYVYDVKTLFMDEPEIVEEPVTAPNVTESNSTTPLPEEFEEPDNTIATCTAFGVYPLPKSMTFVSSGETIPVETIATENEDGTFDVTGKLEFIPEIGHHRKTYRCVVEMGLEGLSEDETTISSFNSTSEILFEHKTTRVMFTITHNPAIENEQVVFFCEYNGWPMKGASIINTDSNIPLDISGDQPTPGVLQITRTAKRGMNRNHYKCTVGDQYDVEKLIVHWHKSYVNMRKGGKTLNKDTIKVTAGSKLDLSCDQEGSPTPIIKWKGPKDTRPGQKPENKFVINEASIHDSGIYTCEGRGGAKKTVKLIVESPCKISLNTHVTTNSDTNTLLNVECITPDANPPCEIQLETAGELADVEHRVTTTTNSLIWVYEDLALTSSPSFTCSARNALGKVEMNKTEGSEEILLQTAAAGISPGLVVVIILLATLVVIGVPYAYYKCCRKSPEDSHTKGNQLDSVEVEKLEATEQKQNRA